MADISRATGLVQAEIDGLAAGPLSAEAYDQYIETLVRAGVPRVQADAEYMRATAVLQGQMFTANNNLRTLQDCGCSQIGNNNGKIVSKTRCNFAVK